MDALFYRTNVSVRTLLNLGYLLVWLILTLTGASYLTCDLFVILGFICLCSLIRKVLNFQPGLLLIIFIGFYLVYLIPVFFFKIPIAYHVLFSSLNNYQKTLSLFTFFLIGINIFLKKVANKVILKDKLPEIRSYPLFILFYLVQFFIIIQAIRTGTSLTGNGNSYETYINNLENSNGLWEYFFIVYILNFLFAPNKLCKQYLQYLTYILYVYVSLTHGYRIQLIEMTFLFFILYFDGKFKGVSIAISAFMGLVFMEIYGLFKLVGTIDIDFFLNNLQSFDTALITNQTEVFYSTTAVLALQASGHFTLAVQAQTFGAFLLNFLIPTGLLWKGSRVLDYMHGVSDIGGGGFIFGYFYFWMGFIGILIVSYFLAWCLNNSSSKNIYKLLYLILLISVSPRWFAYEPTNNLVRLPLTLILIVAIIIRAFKNDKKERVTNS